MESKINYTAVGAFVIALGLALAGMLWWLSSAQRAQHGSTYLVFATDNVNGLKDSSDVLYRGVRVGRVASIGIDPGNPALVRIRIEIDPGVPVRADTVAQLSPQGVTGLSVLNLAGGKASEPLLARAGEPYPVIPYAPSVFSRLEGGLSDATVTLSRIAGRLDQLLSAQNLQSLNSILRNAAAVSAGVAAHGDDIDQTLVAMRQASQELAALGAHGEQLSARSEVLLKHLDETTQRLQRTLDTLDATARTWNGAGQEVTRLGGAGNRVVGNLQQRTLPGLDRLSDNLRSLSAQLTDLVRGLRADPSQLLYGAPTPTPGPGESP